MIRIRIEESPLRVRTMLGSGPIGHNTVADSTRARMIFLEGRHPEYYFPESDVTWDRLAEGQGDPEVDELGAYRAIRVGASPADGREIGRHYLAGPAEGLVRFEFRSMDAWFEEEEALLVHARDPYVRVDVLETSRRIKVSIAGVEVAKSDRPRIVTETGLPPRWYIPRIDINIGLMRRSDTVTSCGYKGKASYWDLVGDDRQPVTDVAWGYERPLMPKLAGLICFYAEKEEVQTLVDGVPVVMPTYHPSWLNPSLFLPVSHLDLRRE